MKFQHIEFNSIGDFFSYLTSAAPPMKNLMPIMLYKGNLMAIIPLGPTSETFLAIYTKNSVEKGIYEFDLSNQVYKQVQSVERADKIYFIVIEPKNDSLAEAVVSSM